MDFLTRTDPTRNIDPVLCRRHHPDAVRQLAVLPRMGRRGSPGTMRLDNYRRREEAQSAEQRTIKRRLQRCYRDR
jgi:predicted DNA-binding WGR domain protein